MTNVHLPLDWKVKCYYQTMRIGELAARVGVTTKTIRYYETIGLIPKAERAPNGYRDYPEDAADRLRFVRDAQETGLSLTEIGSILDLRSQGHTTCEHVQSLLEGHLLDLDRHIEALVKTRTQLAALTARAKTLDPTACVDPNRCQTIAAANPRPHAVTSLPRHLHTGPVAHEHPGLDNP